MSYKCAYVLCVLHVCVCVCVLVPLRHTAGFQSELSTTRAPCMSHVRLSRVRVNKTAGVSVHLLSAVPRFWRVKMCLSEILPSNHFHTPPSTSLNVAGVKGDRFLFNNLCGHWIPLFRFEYLKCSANTLRLPEGIMLFSWGLYCVLLFVAEALKWQSLLGWRARLCRTNPYGFFFFHFFFGVPPIILSFNYTSISHFSYCLATVVSLHSCIEQKYRWAFLSSSAGCSLPFPNNGSLQSPILSLLVSPVDCIVKRGEFDWVLPLFWQWR